MHKKTALFFVMIVLSAQMFSLLHMTSHDSDDHSHHGTVCAHYAYQQDSGATDVPETAGLAEPIFTTAQAESITPILHYKNVFTRPASRAPPLFS